MDGEWLCYREAAERLGSTPDAIRYRALRGKWPRRRGNDGRARVQLPENAQAVRTPSEQPVRTPSTRASEGPLIKALEAHVATLKEQLAAAETRLEKQAAELTDRTAQHAAELVAERETTEKAIAAFSSLADRLDAMVAEKRRPWWRWLAKE